MYVCLRVSFITRVTIVLFWRKSFSFSLLFHCTVYVLSLQISQWIPKLQGRVFVATRTKWRTKIYYVAMYGDRWLMCSPYLRHNHDLQFKHWSLDGLIKELLLILYPTCINLSICKLICSIKHWADTGSKKLGKTLIGNFVLLNSLRPSGAYMRW